MLKKLRDKGLKLRQVMPDMRANALMESGYLEPEEFTSLARVSLSKWTTVLDRFAENVFAAYPMPWCLAEHFKVNGREIPGIPMVTEERTVVAAASKAAKLCDPNGFTVKVGPAISRGHLLISLRDTAAGDAEDTFRENEDTLINKTRELCDRFEKHGGGLRSVDISQILLCKDKDDLLEFTLNIDTVDAMGANGVTEIAKTLGQILEKEFDWKPEAWICTNDNPERTVVAKAVWHPKDVTTETIQRIDLMQGWAETSAERTVTHNKGIMNGIDAVAIATGQDVRAIEAGAWRDVYRHGYCNPLTTYTRSPKGSLIGQLKMQLTVGTVGGATGHPFATMSRRILGIETAKELAAIMGAVGLAQNFAALAWALQK